MSTYVLGDIQGCFRELEQLLINIRFHERDHLILAGDLINRGPHNVETLEFAQQSSNVQCVLGNHDLHFMAVAAGLKQPSSSDTFHDLLKNKKLDRYVDWLRQQPLVLHLPSFDSVVVHAGVPHTWTIDEAIAYSAEIENALKSIHFKTFLGSMYGNTPVRFNRDLTGNDRLRAITNCLTRMRFCKGDGSLNLDEKSDSAPKGFEPWFKFGRPDKTKVLFGHWAAIDGQTGEPQFIALDTGCVWGNKLTAIRLDDNSLFSVPSQSGG